MTSDGARIVYTALSGVPLVEPGDDLAQLIAAAIERCHIEPENGDIIVVAQKIVSKAENRYLRLADISPSPRAMDLAAATRKDPRYIEAVLSESAEVVRVREGLIVVAHRLGYVMANAGIDQSNIEHDGDTERVLLLPRDPDGSCVALKAKLDARFSVKFGVIVNDSFGRAWRNGVTGVALGCAGLPSLRDLVGAPDLFGRPLKTTQIAVADEIAAGASLVMGQAGEGLPLVHVSGVRIEGAAGRGADLIRPKHLDLFR
jgi:coenzyme F420-0:L-glutamate ligase/coenzyme F420-1:gamma-L-glutamate ligase